MTESEHYVVRTTHIQALIRNALVLAEAANGATASYMVEVPEGTRSSPYAEPHHLLCKAISDLRHAADELDAERLSCFGWRQV